MIVVARPIGTHLRRVRLIRRDSHFGWIHRRKIERAFLLREQTALMGHVMIENAEKGLLQISATAVMGLVTAFVPRLGDADRRVVIGLGVVRSIVSRRAQKRRKPLKPRGDI